MAVAVTLFASGTSASFTQVQRRAGNVNGTYTINLHNNCDFKVWPAASQWNRANVPSDQFPLISASQPGLGSDGLGAGSTISINAPTNWLGGRVWPRTDCVANDLASAIKDLEPSRTPSMASLRIFRE
ncbi:hypothetical protein EMMF5_000073 [Cystobasidiomycetes sp. EMM_F5]